MSSGLRSRRVQVQSLRRALDRAAVTRCYIPQPEMPPGRRSAPVAGLVSALDKFKSCAGHGVRRSKEDCRVVTPEMLGSIPAEFPTGGSSIR